MLSCTIKTNIFHGELTDVLAKHYSRMQNHTDTLPAWQTELDTGSIEEDGEAEPELQRALFVGNHASAVDVCLKRDRMADALVLAHVSGDPELWKNTLSHYMKACPRCAPWCQSFVVCQHSFRILIVRTYLEESNLRCMHTGQGTNLTGMELLKIMQIYIFVGSWTL